MHTIFIGLAISFIYSILGAALIYLSEGPSSIRQFLMSYNISFRTIISLGLIIGTALVVFGSRNLIPRTIEAAFTESQLSKTQYLLYKRKFGSLQRSVTFAGSFMIAGFIIFHHCQFPLKGLGEPLMMIAACAQYGFGVYVGRKLFYAGMMLHSLQEATVTRNLFKERELDGISSYVHVVSTLTVIFVYVHVLGYYDGPFLYQSMFGESVKIFLILPALIATPVLLIFNFYPRIVLRRLYEKSIGVEVKKLQRALRNEELSSFEKKSYLLEFDMMYREELRYSLQLTLSDLPIGITILVMVLEPLLGK